MSFQSLIQKRHSIGGNALHTARETELFGGGSLDGNDTHFHAHNLCKAGSHLVDVWAQFWTLQGYGNIHITNLITLFANEFHCAREENGGVDTLVGLVGVGEEFADVARSNGAQQCITQRVDGNISVGVGNATKRRVYFYTANYNPKRCC